MTKKTLPTLLVAIVMVLVAACNTHDDLLVNQPQQTRTLTLTATMPHDGPTTRVALEKKDDNSIALTWQDGDELQLLFVQNDIKEKAIATIKNITEEGKKAQFDIVLPTNINDGNFTLYGIYGGGGLDDANPAIVKLPANPGSATSLADVQTRKDVMLYFKSTNIDAAKPTAAVSFEHLGSLLNITLKNKSTTPLTNIKEVRLVGTGGDGKWAYNHNQGAQTYNLLTGEFENKGSAGNYLSFAAPSNSLAGDAEITFWGWNPPLPDKNWPELKLELWGETTVTSITANSKPARGSAIAAGRAFYFYAIWDGSKVSFTDSSFTPEYFIEEGGLDAALGDDKDNIDAIALRGSVNSADFEVMKSMPSLRHLDLSGVTVAGNKIPDYAFGAAPAAGMGAKNNTPKTSNTNATHTANTTIETVVLPDNITAIGNYAFAQCTNLKGNVTIPNSVISIGDGAFENCNKLDGTLTLPESLETIGARAFQFCKFNSQLILPSNLVSIGEEAFGWCDKLYGDLTIPNTVT
ncbi:MAG TPA: leucine-rich repeat domain-containing protein, partial [Oscillospiraceae bacterium]|nr:leucine-rich repeat domain-containing protein [Oscillospiraceae bacterium]